MMRLKNRTISKDYIFFASLIMAITLIYFLIFSIILYNSYFHSVEQRVDTKADLIVQEINQEINEVSRYAEFIGQKVSEKYNAGSTEELSFLFQRKQGLQLSTDLNNIVHWSSFSFINKNNNLIFENNNSFEGTKDIISLYDFGKSQSNPWTIQFHTPVKLGKYKEYAAIPISFGIQDEKGNYIGSLVSTLYFDVIIEKIIAIVNDSEVYFEIRTNTNVPLFKLVSAKSESSKTSKNTIFVTNKNLNKYPINIKVGYDRTEQLKKFINTLLIHFGQILLISLLPIFIMYIFYNKLISPVKILSNYAKQIVGNDYVDIPSGKYSSIEFKNMENGLRQLEGYKRKLLDSNQQLIYKSREAEQARIHLETLIRSFQDSDEMKARIIKEIRYGTQSSMKYIMAALDVIIKNVKNESEVRLSNDNILQILQNISLEIENIRTFTTESLEESYVNIKEIVEQSITINIKEINSRKVILSVDIANNLGELYSDRTRLYQIINSLIHRSIDFSTEGGKIDIKCYKKSLSNQDYFILEIIDNGYGISEEKRREISKDNNRIYVDGMDLSSEDINKLISLHFGEITIHDEWKIGSKVTLKLPYRKPKVPENNDEDSNIINFTKWKGKKI